MHYNEIKFVDYLLNYVIIIVAIQSARTTIETVNVMYYLTDLTNLLLPIRIS